jgi:hypothetical protein
VLSELENHGNRTSFEEAMKELTSVQPVGVAG